MKANESQVIELVRTGIGVQEVADRMGIKRYQVEYLKRKNGLEGRNFSMLSNHSRKKQKG